MQHFKIHSFLFKHAQHLDKPYLVLSSNARNPRLISTLCSQVVSDVLQGSTWAMRRESPFCCLWTLELFRPLTLCADIWKRGRKSETSPGAAVSFDVCSFHWLCACLTCFCPLHTFCFPPPEMWWHSAHTIHPVWLWEFMQRTGAWAPAAGRHPPLPPRRGDPLPHIPASWAIFGKWVWDPLPSSPGSPCCGGRDLTRFLLCLECLSDRQSC